MRKKTVDDHARRSREMVEPVFQLILNCTPEHRPIHDEVRVAQ